MSSVFPGFAAPPRGSLKKSLRRVDRLFYRENLAGNAENILRGGRKIPALPVIAPRDGRKVPASPGAV